MKIILSFLLLLKPLIELEDWFMNKQNGDRQQLILIFFFSFFFFYSYLKHLIAVLVHTNVFLTLELIALKLCL